MPPKEAFEPRHVEKVRQRFPPRSWHDFAPAPLTVNYWNYPGWKANGPDFRRRFGAPEQISRAEHLELGYNE